MENELVSLTESVEKDVNYLNRKIEREVLSLNERMESEVVRLNTSMESEMVRLTSRMDRQVSCLNQRLDKLDKLDKQVANILQTFNRECVKNIFTESVRKVLDGLQTILSRWRSCRKRWLLSRCAPTSSSTWSLRSAGTTISPGPWLSGSWTMWKVPKFQTRNNLLNLIRRIWIRIRLIISKNNNQDWTNTIRLLYKDPQILEYLMLKS